MTDKYQILEFILLQNFHLSAEIKKSDSVQNKAQIEIQERLEKAFAKSPYEAFFHLAFVKDDIQLSANLAFWKKLASYFVETLRITPSLETLREKQSIVADDFFFSQLLSKAPFFQGSEYLNISSLEYHWNELNSYFQKKIAKYKGTVEGFFRQYSPDIHLVGKIYFHLVEAKDQNAPFAFMATYSVGLNKKKESKHRPLQYALTEFADDQDKMIELLSIYCSNCSRKKSVHETADG